MHRLDKFPWETIEELLTAGLTLPALDWVYRVDEGGLLEDEKLTQRKLDNL